MSKPEVICVLGMHRSGTSVVARLVNLLGVYLGPEKLLVEPGFDNPRGFWEHEELTHLNEEILKRFGGHHLEPPELKEGWEACAELDELRARAQAIISRDFSTAELWGWKDPRTSLTLAFWRQFLPNMSYVVCLRNPLDVARSLEKRNGLSLEKGVDLWLAYVKSALENTSGQPRVFLFYEDVMENWRVELDRLCVALKIPREKSIQCNVQEFLDEELQHHRTSILDTVSDSSLAYPAKSLYLALRLYVNFLQARFDVEWSPDVFNPQALEIFGRYSLESANNVEALRIQVIKERGQLRLVSLELEQSNKDLMELRTEYGDLQRHIGDLRAGLAAKDAALIEQGTMIQEMRDGFARQEHNIGDLRAGLAAKDAALIEQGTTIQEMRDGFARQERHIGDLRAGLAAKDAALIEQGTTIQEMRDGFARQEHNIGELRAVVLAKDAALARQSATIGAIYGSLLWRLTAPFRTLKPTYGRFAHAIGAARVSVKLLNPITHADVFSPFFGPVKRLLRPLFLRLKASPQSPQFEPYIVNMPEGLRKNRPRILHVIANFMTGGSSRLVVDLIEHLGHEYEQQVLTSYLPRPVHYVGVPITELPQGTSVKEITEYLARLAPDLLHVHYWGDCDESWYDLVFRAASEIDVRAIENVNTPVIPYRSPLIERYVFVSDYVQNAFGNGLEARSQRIYPGSDFALFSRSTPDYLSDNCVGMVYRLETDKLTEASIEPFIKTVQRRPQTRVLIVGGGSLLDCFRGAVEAAGLTRAFTFTGYVSYRQLPSLIHQMNVFVAPVWKESFGQVGPFAMSMEIPVVGYDVGAIPEIIGDPRLCAPLGDSDRLAEIIIELLENKPLRISLGKQNRERAYAHFALKPMIEAFGRLYAQTLESCR